MTTNMATLGADLHLLDAKSYPWDSKRHPWDSKSSIELDGVFIVARNGFSENL